MKVQATRLLHYKTSWDLDQGSMEPGELFLVSGFQRDSALAVVHHAMELCAGLALDREGRVEKLIRDICSSFHDLGSSDINRMKAIRTMMATEAVPLPG